MLRWVQVSPDGDQVVYQALGHIWMRPLPDGTPRRLTPQNDHFEFYPSWSRDGKSIVYVTLGRRAARRGARRAGGAAARARDLTTEPGHYVEPAFSARRHDGRLPQGDAAATCARRCGRATPGIYVVAARAASRAEADHRAAAAPHFGAAQRARLLRATSRRRRRQRARSSASTLDGSDERTHVTRASWATEIAVSPDGSWLAFAERFNAYVTPFVADRRSRSSSRRSGRALPVGARVARRRREPALVGRLAAPALVARARALHPRARGRLRLPRGAPETLPRAAGGGPRHRASTSPARPPSGRHRAGRRPRSSPCAATRCSRTARSLVEGNRIVAVGPREPGRRCRADARPISTSAGKTVIPGLVDVHWHGAIGADEHDAGAELGRTTPTSPSA